MSINCYLYAIDAATIERLIADPDTTLPALARQLPPSCDIHKAWHAIHHVLTGTADGGSEPSCFLMEGGETLGEEDLDDGYGPPRLLQPEQVRAFNNVLQPISKLSLLRDRFDHAAMIEAGVYSMNDDGEDEDLEFTAHFFKLLRKFVKQAADAGHGVLISYS